ncbi:MAG: hypothetical protein ACLGIN_05340, partial [Candidatus Sericytochromatia bacterium]
NGLVLDFVRQQGDRLETDLARRDLTINAMAVDLETGELVDPTGGSVDLEAGRIRTISRANFEDDPLRMLRVYRFAAVLGYTVDPATASWVRALAPTITRSAGERILAELGKLLASPRGPEAMAAAEEAGLLRRIWPELEAEGAARGLAASRALVTVLEGLAARGAAGWRTSEVFDQALAGERPVRALLVLAALLSAAPEGLDAVAGRLKWSNKEDAWVRGLVTAPEAAAEAAAAPELERAVYRLWRSYREVALGLVALALARGLDPGLGDRLLEAYWTLHDRRQAAPRLLTGHDLMKELKQPPGPHLGRWLERLDEAQALGEVATREEALACAASWIARGE